MLKRSWLFVPALALVLGACDDDTAAPEEVTTIVDVATSINASTGEFSTLLAAVVAADLVDALAASGQRTVFAPTDAAFAAIDLNASNIGSLPVETLRDILLYHVAPDRRNAASVTSVSSITMANGDAVAISVTGAGAFINDAQIIQTDVEATNGIIHVIDAVLIP